MLGGSTDLNDQRSRVVFAVLKLDRTHKRFAAYTWFEAEAGDLRRTGGRSRSWPITGNASAAFELEMASSARVVGLRGFAARLDAGGLGAGAFGPGVGFVANAGLGRRLVSGLAGCGVDPSVEYEG
jgi:hypothetical protein